MDYDQTLYELRIELVKLQRHCISREERLLVIFEGRDAAGKDGTLRRIIRHLSPRDYRVVALPKPSDRERSQWYFQRYTGYLPAAGEMVFFNRSWYNRAGVEPVMGFCNEQEYQRFMTTVLAYEAMLIQSGIRLIKYYLDISHDEQEARLQERQDNPLKQWKISPIDAVALDNWDNYTRHRDAMLERTHSALSPWTVVNNNDKRSGRINVISDLLERLPYQGKNHSLLQPDREQVFRYHADLATKLSR